MVSDWFFFSVYFLFFGCSTWHVGYQFPDHESEPSTLHWTHGLLGTGPSGKSLFFFLFLFKWMQRHRIMVTIGFFFFFFFYKCFWISKAYTHLISHLSLKLSCWAGRADVSGFAPSFWEGGSDGASDLLSIAQLQKAVLRPFTKLSNSPS